MDFIFFTCAAEQMPKTAPISCVFFNHCSRQSSRFETFIIYSKLILSFVCVSVCSFKSDEMFTFEVQNESHNKIYDEPDEPKKPNRFSPSVCHSQRELRFEKYERKILSGDGGMLS